MTRLQLVIHTRHTNQYAKHCETYSHQTAIIAKKYGFIQVNGVPPSHWIWTAGWLPSHGQPPAAAGCRPDFPWLFKVNKMPIVAASDSSKETCDSIGWAAVTSCWMNYDETLAMKPWLFKGHNHGGHTTFLNFSEPRLPSVSVGWSRKISGVNTCQVLWGSPGIPGDSHPKIRPNRRWYLHLSSLRWCLALILYFIWSHPRHVFQILWPSGQHVVPMARSLPPVMHGLGCRPFSDEFQYADPSPFGP